MQKLKNSSYLTFSFIFISTLALFNSLAFAQPLAQNNTYVNEEIGVRVALDETWQLVTSAANAPPELQPLFPAAKGPNDSPLFFAVHENQQLFARLLTEPFYGNLEDYAGLMTQAMAAQGIEIYSAKLTNDNTALELEFAQTAIGQKFKSRISVLEQGLAIQLTFWTSLVGYDAFVPQMDAIYNEAELINIVGGEADWQATWAQMDERLLAGNVTGAVISEPASNESSALACENPESSMLWEVVSKDNQSSKVHLFGSLHVGKPGFYPFHPLIDTAFRGADHLVFEVDPESAADPAVAQALQARGMLPQGQTLNDVASVETVAELRQILRNLNIPADTFMAMKPWLISVVLSQLQINALGYSPLFGVENYLLTEKSASSEILELESLEEQLTLMENLDQDIMLQSSIEDFADGVDEVESLIEAWRCADKPALVEMLDDDMTSEDASAEEIAIFENFEKLFLFDRNITMANGILDFLENGDGAYFVTVGSFHLLGDKNVISLLEEAGYQVNPVVLTP